MKYTVSYEIEVRPTNVIIELVCKDKEEAEAIEKERKNTTTCLNVVLNSKED